jgi:hypothetical protein
MRFWYFFCNGLAFWINFELAIAHLLTVSPKVPQKEQSKAKTGPVSRKWCSVDRPVSRVFVVVFLEVSVLVSEWGTGSLRAIKTGLIGAVWREDRDMEQATPNMGETEPGSISYSATLRKCSNLLGNLTDPHISNAFQYYNLSSPVETKGCVP